MIVNSLQTSQKSALPPRLVDLEAERLKEFGQSINMLVKKMGFSRSIPIQVNKLNTDRFRIFEAFALDLKTIILQKHWLINPTDIPNTDNQQELCQWFSYFMGIPSNRINDQYFHRVVLPVINLVRSEDFTSIRECILLHETGHIVLDGSTLDRIVLQRKVIRYITRLTIFLSAVLLPVTWYLLSNHVLFAALCLILISCLTLNVLSPGPGAPAFSESCTLNNEKKADLFAARAAPEKIPALINYFKWHLNNNKMIKNDFSNSQNLRDSYDLDGEIRGNITHPKYTDRIKYLKEFLEKNRGSKAFSTKIFPILNP